MGENDQSLSRREALKMSAKVAGVAAFATPTVVGVFAAPAIGQDQISCNGETDSDAVFATISGELKRNQNCGGNNGEYARYNAQDAAFEVVPGVGGTINVGAAGVDNYDVRFAFYTITQPENYECVANWSLQSCPHKTNPVPSGTMAWSTPPPGTLPLPYCLGTTECTDNPAVFLILDSVVCCPT